MELNPMVRISRMVTIWIQAVREDEAEQSLNTAETRGPRGPIEPPVP